VSKVTRRRWLAALPFAGAVALKAAASSRTLGAQLYSVRGILRKDPGGTLKAIARIGYKEVEGYDRAGTIALLPKIKESGLTPRSCQTETPLITADWESYPELKQISLTAAIDSLSSAGIEFFTMGYISPGARGDGDDFYRRTADRMNAAAELCRKSGLKFAWQNHAFDFEGRPGRRPIDIFNERLDPKLVRLELDVFWASVAGYDPIRLLKEWKGRVSLVHLNDKAKDAPVQFSESIGQGAYAEPGSGVLDFPAILKAATSVGVQYYFTGQPENEGDPLESLRGTFNYLRKSA
jgi:sugar phosphate isomerase/epimerase